MKINYPKVLVIGGSGFLGYHFAKLCLRKKYNVISVSRFKPKSFRKLKKVKYFFFDISKKKINKQLLSIKKIDYVVNFGGEINHKKKKSVYESHFVGVKNLINIFLKKNIKRFIQIGSSMEYGLQKSPHQNFSKCFPISNYGKAKYKSTKILIKAHKKYNFPVVILRPYQVFGPNQEINRLIPFVVNNCLKNNQFPCSNGKQKRDFLYVSDFTNAVFKFLKKKNIDGKIFNIGSGFPVRVKKIITFIRSIIGFGRPMFGKISLRKEEMLNTYPNISNLKNDINWTPKFSLKKGLIKTINYYKKINK